MKLFLGLTIFGFVNTLKVDVYARDVIDCHKEKCPNEYTACQMNFKCISIIQNCQSKCGTGTTCWQECLSGTKDSLATNLSKCAATQQCVGYEPIPISKALLQIDVDCLFKYCSEQYITCVSDQKCLLEGQKCDQQCTQSSGDIDPICWKNCAVKSGNANAVSLIQCTLDHNCWD